MPKKVGNMPLHDFGVSHNDKHGQPLAPDTNSARPMPPGQAKKQMPDDVCKAMLITATEEVDGYGMVAQCGHLRSEH